MKKQIVAPLILAFGLAMLAQPTLAMKRRYPQSSDSVNVMVSTFVTAMGWIWARYNNALENDLAQNTLIAPQSLTSATTFVSAQGTHFFVSDDGLNALAQLSITIANMLSDVEGMGVNEIPVHLVSDPALHLLTQAANGAQRETLLNYIRSLNSDEIEKLKQDAQFLDSPHLQMLIRRALNRLSVVSDFLSTQPAYLDFDDPFYFQPNSITLVSQSGSSFDVVLSELDALMDLAPKLANIISSLEGSDLSTIHVEVSSSTLYLLKQMADGADRDNLFSYINDLNASELEALKGDAHFLESSALLDLLSDMPNMAALKFQSLIRGTNVRKEAVLPSELEDYLAQNLPDLTGEPLDFKKLSKTLAREILAHKELSNEWKRLIEDKEEYSFSVHDCRGDFSHSEKIKLPVGVWIKPMPDGIELELVGKELGEGSYKTVYRSRRIFIDLQTTAHTKKMEDAVIAHIYGDYKMALQGMDVLRRAFTPEERQDPDLRVAGDLTLLDRINPNTGDIEARDVEYAGDLEDVFRAGLLDLPNLLRVFADVAVTLTKFHAKGFVHHDMHAGNILVSKDSLRGFLSDFDFLREISSAENPFSDISRLAEIVLELTEDLPRHWSLKCVRKAAKEVVLTYNGQIYEYIESLRAMGMTEESNLQDMIDKVNNAFPAFRNFHVVLKLTTLLDLSRI